MPASRGVGWFIRGAINRLAMVNIAYWMAYFLLAHLVDQRPSEGHCYAFQKPSSASGPPELAPTMETILDDLS